MTIQNILRLLACTGMLAFTLTGCGEDPIDQPIPPEQEDSYGVVNFVNPAQDRLMNLPSITANRVADSISKAFGLGNVQASTILEAILDAYDEAGITRDPSTWERPAPTMQRVVDKYLDDAVLAGIPTVRIIHGKGTGALRAALWKYFKTDSRIKSYRHGAYGEGDAGVTVIEFKQK